MVYCIPIFGGCDKGQMKALQVMQNKAAQIVCHFPPRSRRSVLYDRVGWLTVNKFVVHHSLIAVFKIRSNKEPEYLAGKLALETPTGCIMIPNTKLGLAHRAHNPLFIKLEQYPNAV